MCFLFFCSSSLGRLWNFLRTPSYWIFPLKVTQCLFIGLLLHFTCFCSTYEVIIRVSHSEGGGHGSTPLSKFFSKPPNQNWCPYQWGAPPLKNETPVTVPNLKGSYNSRFIKLTVHFLIIYTNRCKRYLHY